MPQVERLRRSATAPAGRLADLIQTIVDWLGPDCTFWRSLA